MKRSAAIVLLPVIAACSQDSSHRTAASSSSTASKLPPAYSSPAQSRAESLYFAGEYDSALAIWRHALSTDSIQKDSAAQAHILMWLGMRQWRLGNYDSARTIAEQSLALKLRLKRTGELSRSYNSLGLIARDEGRLVEARSLFTKAMETARAVSDTAGINRGAINLALVLQDLGEFTEAQKGFETARDAGKALGDARLEGNALNNLAALLIKMGDPAGAIPLLHRAVDRYRTIEYNTGIQNSMGQLAVAYDVLGESQKAFAMLDTASHMAQELGLKQEQENNLRIYGELYQSAGDHQRALDFLSRARTLSTQLGLDQETGIILRGEARSQIATGRSDLALARMSQALKAHRAQKALFEEMTDLIGMSEIAADDQAKAFSQEAVTIAAKINTPSARVDAALGVARLGVRTGDWHETLSAINSIRNEMSSARSGGVWEAYALEARAYAALGKLDSAAESGRKAVAQVDRVRSRIGTGSLRTTFISERAGVYADLVMILLRLNKSAEAFEIADGARGRELLEHLADSRRDVAGQRGQRLADAERLLRQIDELTRMLNEADRVPQRERAVLEEQRLSTIAGKLEKLEGDYESLVVSAGDTQLSHDVRAGGSKKISAIQHALLPDEALVEYMVTPDRLLIFVARSNSLTQLSSPITEGEIAGRVRIARGIAAKRGNVNTRDNAVFRALDELLIAPVEKSHAISGVKRLVIVPHASLTYVPFAALIAQDGKYLSDRYSILHASSAASLASGRAASAAQPRSSRAIVLAPFPDLLPATRREARDVERSLSSTRVLLGASATEGALRSALTQSSIVHVASHGVLNTRNPLFSRIELARSSRPGVSSSIDDGRLDIHELLGLNVVSRLVFLSGCETGVGSAWSTDFARGDDFATLAQAFLFSGAREVVATLWRLDDEAAAVFASAFYKNMKVVPPAEALARAQLEVRRDPRMKAPYYWAAYTLTGSGDRLKLEKPWWNPFN